MASSCVPLSPGWGGFAHADPTLTMRRNAASGRGLHVSSACAAGRLLLRGERLGIRVLSALSGAQRIMDGRGRRLQRGEKGSLRSGLIDKKREEGRRLDHTGLAHVVSPVARCT